MVEFNSIANNQSETAATRDINKHI